MRNESGTNVILLRHSVPAIDPAVPSFHWELSPEGRRRANAIARQVKRLEPDAIYSSPEPKAIQTAEIVAATMNLNVKTIEALREHDRTGVPFLRGVGEFEEHLLRLFANPGERVFGAESAAAALGRFSRGVDVAAAHGDHRPLLVTHGTVMSLYMAAVSGLDAATLWRELSMPCYVVLDGQPGGAEVSIEHLRE